MHFFFFFSCCLNDCTRFSLYLFGFYILVTGRVVHFALAGVRWCSFCFLLANVFPQHIITYHN